MPTRDLGQAGERAAHRALRKRGYKLLAANWRCRYGELDAVATHRGVLCFIEVKTQAPGSAVAAAEEVTDAKQERLSRVAAEFLRQTGRLECLCRFDVVTVVMDERDEPHVEVIADAFPGAPRYG